MTWGGLNLLPALPEIFLLSAVSAILLIDRKQAGEVVSANLSDHRIMLTMPLKVRELRETLIMLAPYAGYPNVAPLIMACEEVISTWEKDGRPGPAEPTT